MFVVTILPLPHAMLPVTWPFVLLELTIWHCVQTILRWLKCGRVTTLTFQCQYVTWCRSWLWPFYLHCVGFCGCFVDTDRVSWTVFKILSLKYIRVAGWFDPKVGGFIHPVNSCNGSAIDDSSINNLNIVLVIVIPIIVNNESCSRRISYGVNTPRRLWYFHQ